MKQLTHELGNQQQISPIPEKEMADVGTLLVEKKQKVKKQKEQKPKKQWQHTNLKVWLSVYVFFLALGFVWIFASLLTPVQITAGTSWGIISPFWIGKNVDGSIQNLPSINGWLILAYTLLLIVGFIVLMQISIRQKETLSQSYKWQKRWVKLSYVWITITLLTLATTLALLMAMPYNVGSYFSQQQMVETIRLINPDSWININDFQIGNQAEFIKAMNKAFDTSFADGAAATTQLEKFVNDLNKIFNGEFDNSDTLYEKIYRYYYGQAGSATITGVTAFGSDFQVEGLIFSSRYGYLSGQTLNASGIAIISVISVALGFSVIFPFVLAFINSVQNFQPKGRESSGLFANIKDSINKNRQLNTMRREEEKEMEALEKAEQEAEELEFKMNVVNNSDSPDFKIDTPTVPQAAIIDVDKAFDNAKKVAKQIKNSSSSKRHKRKTEVALPDEELSKIFDELDI